MLFLPYPFTGVSSSSPSHSSPLKFRPFLDLTL
jgi:hypothetical protein